MRPSIRKHRAVMHGGRGALDVLDFSSNINPLGCPRNVLEQMQKSLKDVIHYPDAAASGLLAGLEKYTGLPESNLVAGNGASEIIYNFCRYISGLKVLIPVPTFQEYEAASLLNECKVSYLKVPGRMDAGRLIPKIPRNGCVFVCNPNNPTGVLHPKDVILDITRAAQDRGALVFVDECFIEMTPRQNTVIHYTKKLDNLVVLRSLTKSFGLPGIRLGYAAGPKGIIQTLKNIKIPWSINHMAQTAGIAALGNKQFLARANKLIIKEYRYLTQEINKIDGFECMDSAANFILIKSRRQSSILQKELLKKKILIRDCGNFRGLSGRYIRIAIKTHRENLKLVRELQKSG